MHNFLNLSYNYIAGYRQVTFFKTWIISFLERVRYGASESRDLCIPNGNEYCMKSSRSHWYQPPYKQWTVPTRYGLVEPSDTNSCSLWPEVLDSSITEGCLPRLFFLFFNDIFFTGVWFVTLLIINTTHTTLWINIIGIGMSDKQTSICNCFPRSWHNRNKTKTISILHFDNILRMQTISTLLSV